MADNSNFTQPDDLAGGQARPAGTGDNSETWDPVTKRWIPRSQMPAQSLNGVQPGMYSPTSGGGDARTGAAHVGGYGPDQQQPGRVQNDLAWGGYSSTLYRDANGNVVNDPSANGVRADVDRYRGLGAAAANRGAYQNDYSQANADAAMAAQARGGQFDATRMARDWAVNGNATSQALGQRMLTQGAQTQQAAALSTRGGSLAQATALRNQQAGQAAYMQQGQNALAAQRADDMAMGRGLYQQNADAMRSGDATAQGLHQRQATSQMQNEIGQRRLNDQQQQGYEGLGYDVQAAQQDAGLRDQEIDNGINATNDAAHQAEKDRDQRMVGIGTSMVGTVLGAGSDERMKQHVHRMNLASAVVRKAGC